MAASQGTMQKSYVSAIDFLDQRDIDPKLYDQSRDIAFTDIMKVVNKTKPAKMFQYHQFVNNDVYETANVSAVTTTGAAQIVFTINSATGFPRKYDAIKTSNAANAGKEGWISNVTGNVITAESVDGTNLTVAISDKVQFISNAYPEKSTYAANRRYSMTKYYNVIQIFGEVDEITDVQKVARIEVDVNNNGQTGMLAYQTLNKYTKLKGDISAQMLIGTLGDGLFSATSPLLADPSTGYGVQFTGGLDWYAITYGISDTVASLGTFTFTDFDEICNNLIANKAPNSFYCFSSSRPLGILSQFFKNLGSSGVTSVRMVINGRSLDLNVDKIEYRGFTFKLVHVPIFDHPNIIGTSLADINGSLYMVPDSMVDTVGGGQESYIQIRYTPTPYMGNSANRSSDGMVTEIRTGALAEVSTSEEEILRTTWKTRQGLEVTCPKHIQKYRIV